MLAHYIINPDMRHNMDVLSETYLNYTPQSIEELIGKKGKNQANMRDVALEKITEYAVEDADVTLQLKQFFISEGSPGTMIEFQQQKYRSCEAFNRAEKDLTTTKLRKHT